MQGEKPNVQLQSIVRFILHFFFLHTALERGEGKERVLSFPRMHSRKDGKLSVS